SLEAVLDVEPDLVTASFTGTLSEAGTISPDRLADLGVPSYLSASECGKSEEGNTDGTRAGTLEIATILQEIRDLATLVGEPARGADLVASLEQRLAAVERPGGPVSALFWFANAESPY